MNVRGSRYGLFGAVALFLCVAAGPGLAQQPPAVDHADHAADVDHAAHAVAAGHSIHAGHAGHGAAGMASELPANCSEISADVSFLVYAGARYAAAWPQRSFAYSQHDFRVPPCSRVSVTLVNEDQVRHQWMLHGLPRYLYPGGMFHLEANGGQTVSGSFIVPADDATYLVHCDMAQHTEKGMKAQLIAGKGSGNLWSVPGISQDFRQAALPAAGSVVWVGSGLLIALAISAILAGRRQRSRH